MTSAAFPPPSVTVRVPAKINLELLVGPPREDGYHPLATVFHAVNLFDEVTVSASEEWGLSVSGPQSLGVPADGTNLAADGTLVVTLTRAATASRRGRLLLEAPLLDLGSSRSPPGRPSDRTRGLTGEFHWCDGPGQAPG